MGHVLTRVGHTFNLQIKHFTCDEKSDLDKIDLTLVPPGSTAKIIANGAVYMLNTQRQWVLQPTGSSSGGGGESGGGTGDSDDHYIWDSGEI